MDAEDVLETMKAELARMRHEKICMEAKLTAAESVVEEKKRVLAELKAIENLVDDLLLEYISTIEVGSDNVHENNGLDLDEETMKALIEEAMRVFTEALNEAQSRGSRRPADGGNSGGNGYDGSFSDQNLDGTNINNVNDGGAYKGSNGGGQAL